MFSSSNNDHHNNSTRSSSSGFQYSTVVEQIKQYLSQIPFGTLSLLFLMSFIFFIMQCIFDTPSIDQVCLNYYSITENNGFYRLVSYAFFHSDIMHYLFNMMTHISFGSSLESGRFKSSVKFLICTFILVMIESVLELVVGFLLSNVLVHYPTSDKSTISVIFNALGSFFGLRECSIGFSGVIFSYITIQSLDSYSDSSSSTNSSQQVSIFGLLTLPSKYYPWALLFITTLLFPNSSLIGHLFGILSGLIFVFLFEKRSNNSAIGSGSSGSSGIRQRFGHYLDRVVLWIENCILIPPSVKQLNSFYALESAELYTASGGELLPQFRNNSGGGNGGGSVVDNATTNSYWNKLTGGRTLGDN